MGEYYVGRLTLTGEKRAESFPERLKRSCAMCVGAALLDRSILRLLVASGPISRDGKSTGLHSVFGLERQSVI